MGFRSKVINWLGGGEKTANSYSRGNDFLRYGNRGKDILMPDWADIKMSDRDLYKGYSYAAIQKRANKVATLARTNLYTYCNDELAEALREKGEDAFHPYLKLIEDSTDFSQKQFWKNISIYLDLAGVYYLGIVRGKIPSNNPNAPDLYTPAKSFVMLNPYEIKRVLDKDKNVVGYIEQKPDGRQREWAPHMIIEMRELNPFDTEKIWSLSDAAREAAFTINQSNDYTRKTLAGNINAPGIVTTDVILDEEQFKNFRERIVHHTSGEPLFGNGTGAINWQSMTNDLDKSALGEINEMNRTALFAVSGVSKTTLGIEQSGTTRETSRVQSEQFLSDTIQPRIEDIIDFLNLDYRRHYKEEYDRTGYYIEIQGFGSKDYDTSMKATQAHTGEINLALDLIDMGYTLESAYQYASGEIEIEDLVLEEGKEKPERPQQGGDMFGGMLPEGGNPDGGDGGDNGNNPEAPSEPSGELTEPTEGGAEATNDLEDGMAKKIESVDELFHFMENHEESCTCEDCKNPTKIEVYENELSSDDAKELRGGYQNFLAEIRGVEGEIFDEACNKISRNSFEEIDIISKEFKKKVINKLQSYIDKYWRGLVVLFGDNTVAKRNTEFGTGEKFSITNDIQGAIVFKATETAQNHVQTIIRDILKIGNKVYTDVMEETAADLLIDRVKQNPDKYKAYFAGIPSKPDALKAVRKTDILEFDKKLYQKAYETAIKGQSREKISQAIRDSFDEVSKKRADLIARNETSRAFNYTQYEADLQFLTNTGRINNAYKQLYSRSGNPCPLCQEIINMGPIPFTKNFVDFGGTVDYVDENGKNKQFVANYEPIQGGVVHVNCNCSYRLVLKNDKVENTYYGLFDPNDSSVSNTVQLLSNYLNEGEVKNFNPNHDELGRFAEGDGVGSAGSLNTSGILDSNGQGISLSSEKLDKDWSHLFDGVLMSETTEKMLKTYYFGSWYFHNIQKVARGKYLDTMSKGELKKSNEIIDTMDNLLDGSSLDEDITLYRGVALRDEDAEKILSGSTITDKGYASTTLNPSLATWKRGGVTGNGKRNMILLKINAKAGSRCLKSPVKTEYEVVLPRNVALKVKKMSDWQELREYDKDPNFENKRIRVVEVDYAE